jgi:hypothetical protein
MKSAIAVLLLFCALSVRAQDTLAVTEGFSETPDFCGRKIWATGMVGGFLAGSLVGGYFDWWDDNSEPFHFFHEGWFNDNSLGIDKVGHLYTSYFYFHTFRNIMLWGGYKAPTAFWWAAGTTAFFALSIEIGDGFSPYGFDSQDLLANVIGLGYAMLQTDVPFTRNFNLKWSYVPRDGYRWPPRFTDHYDAHTYWLTVNVHNLLPSSMQDYWPELLQLAVGYGVDDNQTKREGVIGLDFNLDIFPTHNEDLLLLRKTANYFHIPAPAVKFTTDKKPKYYLFHLN